MWGGRQSTFPTLEQEEVGERIGLGRKRSWFLMLLHFQKLLGYGFFLSILSVPTQIQAGNCETYWGMKLQIESRLRIKGTHFRCKDLLSYECAGDSSRWLLRITGKKKCRQVKDKACFSISQIIYVSDFFFLDKLSLSCLIQCLGAKLTLGYTFKLMSRQPAHGWSF